jgi:hypothetical protein
MEAKFTLTERLPQRPSLMLSTTSNIGIAQNHCPKKTTPTIVRNAISTIMNTVEINTTLLLEETPWNGGGRPQQKDSISMTDKLTLMIPLLDTFCSLLTERVLMISIADWFKTIADHGKSATTKTSDKSSSKTPLTPPQLSTTTTNSHGVTQIKPGILSMIYMISHPSTLAFGH